MQYYFCSTIPFALKINGEFISILDSSPLPFTPKTSTSFIEAYPVTDGATNVMAFVLNEKLLNYPPNGVIVTDLNGGYLITLTEQPKFLDFSIISQQKYPFALVTVFTQNGYNLTIETQDDFYTQTLPLPKISSVQFNLISDKVLALGIFGEKRAVLVFDLSRKINKLLEILVDNFELSPTLVTTQKFLDIKKHVKQTEWQYVNGVLNPKTVSFECDSDFNQDKLCTEILPYAFLEEFLVGGNYQSFLGENVAKNSNKLKLYLGDFIGVCPPPAFIPQNKVGLIYNNGRNRYKLKYASFELVNRKITNISLE